MSLVSLAVELVRARCRTPSLPDIFRRRFLTTEAVSVFCTKLGLNLCFNRMSPEVEGAAGFAAVGATVPDVGGEGSAASASVAAAAAAASG